MTLVPSYFCHIVNLRPLSDTNIFITINHSVPVETFFFAYIVFFSYFIKAKAI